MRAVGIVFLVLTLISSGLATLCVPAYLLRNDGGHEGILYAVGLFLALLACVFGVVASLVLRGAPVKTGARRSIFSRWPWLPLAFPVLVLAALHLMLLAK